MHSVFSLELIFIHRHDDKSSILCCEEMEIESCLPVTFVWIMNWKINMVGMDALFLYR